MTHEITSEELAKIEAALGECELSLFDASESLEALESRCSRFVKVREAWRLVRTIRTLRTPQKTS